MLRKDFEDKGFDIKNWKGICNADPTAVRTILEKINSDSIAMMFLNSLVESRCNPQPDLLQRVIGQTYHRDGNSKVLSLLFRESAQRLLEHPKEPQVDLILAYINVLDYVSAMDREGRDVTSKKWSGLLKKSERWHRDLRQRREMDRWISEYEKITGVTAVGTQH